MESGLQFDEFASGISEDGRHTFDGLNGEAGLAPAFEPPAQRVDILEADGGRAKGDPGVVASLGSAQ